MIYTLTLNPSLDYYMHCDSFIMGQTNRSKSEGIIVGGKGINVSKALKEQRIDSVALGFVGGFIGQQIVDELNQLGIKNDFVCINGLTRINVKVVKQEITELNGSGPHINDDEIKQLLNKLELLEKDDILIMSGSVSNGCDENIYAQICERLNKRQVKCIVDASKEPLIKSLNSQPYVVKPNLDELQQIFSKEINTINDVKKYGCKIKDITNADVIISLGNKGAIYIDDNKKTYYGTCSINEVKNTVGAGDTMLASYIGQINIGTNKLESFKYCLAAASAYCTKGSFVNKEEISQYLGKVVIKEI